MSMTAVSSPTSSLFPFPALRLRMLAAVALLFASALLPAQAQLPFADIASADRVSPANVPAFRALQEGRVDEAAALLHSRLASSAGDAIAHQLLCRVYYAQDAADEAIRECELAVSSGSASSPDTSDSELWLGRAYGMKASHAGPIAGFKLARKVQSSFSRAVELNPSNLAALNDLGEYYVAAPFIVGGGDDKAKALAAQMMPRFPSSAHRLLARLADSNKDLGTAESEFKQAIAAQKTPETWIDLAHFYEGHGRYDEALAAVKSGLTLDRTHGPALVDAASILTAAHRAPDLAERCLRDYLASHAKSDAAPAFKVHVQLSRLLAARGDNANASREADAAAALASAFARRSGSSRGQ